MKIDDHQHSKIEEIIRVNHAGEYGAKQIYQGQIYALKIKGDYKTLKIIEQMKEQELSHLEYFEKKIIEHKVRPTVMQPIWKIGGFALGFLTAIIDKKSAMTCTTAVEEIIDQHYQSQITEIDDIKEKNQDLLKLKNNQSIKSKKDKTNKLPFDQSQIDQEQKIEDLYQNINKFRLEEIEHRDTAYSNNAKDFIFYKPLDMFIKFTTRLAINISKKI